jgi:PAS domain S-box-containing protein
MKPSRDRAERPSLRVLILEDNEDDRVLMKHEIARSGYVAETRCVDTADALVAALAEDWDIILSDYQMPGFGAARALELVHESGKDIPFIVVSGTASEDTAVEMMKAGAQDFFSKDRLARLMPAIEREVEERARRAQLHDAEAQREGAVMQWLTTLESMSEGFCSVEPDWSVSYLNRAGEELVGRTSADVLGRPWSELGLDADDASAARHAESMEVRRPVAFEAQLGVGAAARWVEVRSYPARATGGLAIFLRDITALRRFEERREALLEQERRARTEAEMASRMKDEFLSTLSHELRTPLTTTLGWAQVLQKGRLTAETQTRAYEAIERAARQQVMVVNDIFDMSRLVSGRVQLRVRTVDLSHVVEAALAAAHAAALAKTIQLEVHLDGAGTVIGDPQRLRQVVWNLVANAIKFTPRGGAVRIRLARSDGKAVLTVEDSGQGINPEFLPSVFDTFRQGDGGRTRAHGGLGLGLALTRQLVELHGGTIAAASPGPGLGARFTVTLPLGQAPAAVDGVAAPLRVLLIAADGVERDLARAVLECEGAEVTVAAGLDEALPVLRAGRTTVLVAEAAGADAGAALVGAVRALPPEQGGWLPAVALIGPTGQGAAGRAHDPRRALAAGFQLHVPVPIEPERLVAVACMRRRGGRSRRRSSAMRSDPHPPLVLIVDDDDDVRTFLRELLEEEGYAVATAGNGLEALEFTERARRQPACVLLDLMMPIMNGWDVMAAWREQGKLPGLPVVVFTAAVHAKGPPGARRYLRKPADAVELMSTIREACTA